MTEGAFGELPEGMATVKLPAGLRVRNAQFAAGTVAPCLASAQLAILKQAPNAPYHLLTGLYAYAAQAGSSAPGFGEVAAQLLAAEFPLPPRDGGLVLPKAQLRVGNILLCLVEGNIATCATEVIVNAANDQLQMGGGVAGAIRSKGGIELEAESRRHAPARLGDIVRTSAGRLKARELYHAVVIEFVHMQNTAVGDVESSFHKVLDTALEEGVSSVAVPFLGCGVGALSIPDVTEAYLAVARRVAAVRKRGLLLLLIAYGEEDAQTAAAAMAANADPAAGAREMEDFLKEAERLLGRSES